MWLTYNKHYDIKLLPSILFQTTTDFRLKFIENLMVMLSRSKTEYNEYKT